MKTLKQLLLVPLVVMLMLAATLMILTSTRAALPQQSPSGEIYLATGSSSGANAYIVPTGRGITTDREHILAGTSPVNDGGFENVPSAWTEAFNATSCSGLSKIGNWSSIFGFGAYQGSQSLWVGGVCVTGVLTEPIANSAEQLVTVPNNESLLSFWYYADRIDDDDFDDYAYVEVSGVEMWRLDMTLANDTGDWVKATLDLSGYAGEPVTLKFGNTTGPGSLVGNVLFDLVSFESSIVGDVDPATGGALDYTDSQGNPTAVEVPPGAVTDTVVLSFTPLDDPGFSPPSGFQFVNHNFDLDALPNRVYLPSIMNDGSSGMTAVIVKDDSNINSLIGESAGDTYFFLKPVTITISYSNGDVTGIDENSLRLYYWTGSGWEDAATTCEPSSVYSSDPTSNIVQLSVCHLSRFGVIGAN